MSILDELGLTGAQYNALRSLSNTELSASAIIDQLAGTDAAIRRASGLKAVKAFRDITDVAPYIGSVGYDKGLNAGRIPRSVGEQKRRYSYEIRFDVRNKDTGETTFIHRNYSVSDLVTKQQAVDAWLEQFATNKSTSEYEITDYTVTTISEDISYRTQEEGSSQFGIG